MTGKKLPWKRIGIAAIPLVILLLITLLTPIGGMTQPIQPYAWVQDTTGAGAYVDVASVSDCVCTVVYQADETPDDYHRFYLLTDTAGQTHLARLSDRTYENLSSGALPRRVEGLVSQSPAKVRQELGQTQYLDATKTAGSQLTAMVLMWILLLPVTAFAWWISGYLFTKE